MKIYSLFRVNLVLIGLVFFSCLGHAQDQCADPFACNFTEGTTGQADCCYSNCLTLTMTDGFGDGWNGAIWEVANLLTGSVLASGTLADGLEEVVNVCVPDGCYFFTVGSGTFDAEITWILQGANEGDLGGGAPSTTFFNVGNGCLEGCTDPNACNFDIFATIDDGSCNFDCFGCTDPLACNFSSVADVDDASCQYIPANDLFENNQLVVSGQAYQGNLCCAGSEVENPCVPVGNPGDVWYQVNSGICSGLEFDLNNGTSESLGMTIWSADCMGCTELTAVACCPEVTGQCAGDLASIISIQPNWDYYFSVWTTNTDGCGTFSFEITCTGAVGCTNPLACNFDPMALNDDGSCLFLDECGECGGEGFPGCMDSTACNFDPSASCPDDSCEYALEVYLDCDGNCLSDSNNDGICDGQPLLGCDTEFACNYDPLVTENDGSCYFATAVYDCEGNCQEDADGDGICDQNEGQNGADFCGEDTVWDPVSLTCIGVDDCPADLNNDEVIDTIDLLSFLIFFGTSCE